MGSDGEFEGTEVTQCQILPAHTGDGEIIDDGNDLRAALKAIQADLAPCGGQAAERLLAVLRARTKARAQDAESAALTSASYAVWLGDYPFEIAEKVCEDWARNNVFWPAWADLQRTLDRLAAPKLAIRKALNDALKPPAAKLYLGKPPEETRSDRMTHSMNAYLRHGLTFKAAEVEKKRAREENRPVEEWASHVAPAPAPPSNAQAWNAKPFDIPKELQIVAMRHQAKTLRMQGHIKMADYHDREADKLDGRQIKPEEHPA